MKELNNVTLACVCTDRHNDAIIAAEICRKEFKFAEIVFFVSEEPKLKPAGIRFVIVPRLTDRNGTSDFVFKFAKKHLSTEFSMWFHWHGFILNPSKWEDGFLDYDFIGAPWNWIHTGENTVGNGGFCIRSKRFFDAAEEIYNENGLTTYHPEDALLCRAYYKEMVAKGIKFAPEKVARRFSVENEPYNGGFGMHEIPKDIIDLKILELMYGAKITFGERKT